MRFAHLFSIPHHYNNQYTNKQSKLSKQSQRLKSFLPQAKKNTLTTMSLFKSNKNKTASAATTPAQTPRTSLNEQRPPQTGTKMTRDQALETALNKTVQSPARFSNIM